ncbi:MAG: F0F1 ATP synthase subunit epsilon [Clostridia bacterium]|nr:F0F1 ATP synthase subunit epsilon [Clostridia bacterium]
MRTFDLKISTPDGDLYSAPAVQLIVRGFEGELAIMAGHVPFMTAVKPCVCRVTQESGEVREGQTDGGILSVGTDGVTLLSGSFNWKDNN